MYKPPSTSVHTCSNAFEAAFIKNYLAGHGIAATFDGEDALGFTGRYGVLGKGVAVRVAPGSAARARALLAAMPEPEAAPDEAVPGADEEDDGLVIAPPAACPNCASAHIGSALPPRWLDRLLLGLPRRLAGGTWHCADCGWSWRP
jgi:hypothetical protein